ncbi:MAG: response regulator [Bacteroidetes bacterium]|nr:response regulator [Bacteroidota bacterium]
MTKAKVLIMDTNVDDTDEIESLLSGSHVELVIAGSPEEAIDLAKRSEIALVIVKVTPDSLSGFDLADQIRRIQKNEHLNIIYTTDYCCTSYYNNEVMLSGAVDFIARPFIAGTLKGKVDIVINQYLQQKRLLEQLEQRKAIEDGLINAKQLEEDAGIAKKQFLSTMSHEIRTPLNAIINTVNLLISEQPRPDQVEDMDVLKFSAENLLQMINEVLDFSKIDSGKIEFEEIDFNIRKLIAGIRQSMQYGMMKEGIELEFITHENVPGFLMGDSVRLAQIFFNLVGNALKFTKKGKVTLSTEVYRDLEDSVEILFRISDTGIGIPEEKQKDIFEAFTQASASTTREYGGTGLGLAITKMLIEKQNGRIQVESKPNEGSTFSVFLKFKRSTKNQVQERPLKSAEIHSLEGLNILIVEDNLINQNIVSRLLVKWNANTDTAENGKVAVQKVKENQYQLVLMDLHMPEMNGYEATQKIREMEGDYYKNLPILAVTASAFVEDRKKICDSGMNGYIIKPFHPAELNSKISRFLEHKVPAA